MCSASVRSGLRGSLYLLLVGVLQYHCVILWAVSTFTTKAFIAASCHGVVLWVVRHRNVFIDPRVSLTEILCHFRTLLPLVCSHDFLSLVVVTCFAMSFALRSAAIARLILDASLLHCTRAAVPTLLNFADQSFF